MAAKSARKKTQKTTPKKQAEKEKRASQVPEPRKTAPDSAHVPLMRTEAVSDDEPKSSVSDEAKVVKEAGPEEVETQSEISKTITINKKTVLTFFIGMMCGFLLLSGIFVYMGNTQKSPDQPETVSESEEDTSPSPSEEPSPSPEEVVDFEDYIIQVLNGSGMIGEAGKVQVLLMQAGFDMIETGNADSYDYLETEVSVKENTPGQVYDEIETALEDYVVIEGNELDEDSEYDVVIIVGSERVEEELEEIEETEEDLEEVVEEE